MAGAGISGMLAFVLTLPESGLRGGEHRFECRKPLNQVAQGGELFEAGDANQGDFEQQSPVNAAAQSGAAFAEDLQCSEDRLERPAVNDAFQLVAIRGETASSSDSAPTARTMPSRNKSISPPSRSAGRTPSRAICSRSASAAAEL